MYSPKEISRVRQAIQEIREHLVREHGKEIGYYHFGDCSPGIVSDVLSRKSNREIIAKVDRLISDRSERQAAAGIANENGPAQHAGPDLNVIPKRKVRLIAEGRLAGGLTVPVGTVCSVEKRDFHGGRATLDVVKDDAILFEVFEDEVEYLEGEDI
jgi:hypothetical protein